MGSTFAAVHLRGASLDALTRLVTDRLRKDGFIAAPELAENDEAEARRILLFEDRGWTTLTDSAIELDDEKGEAWAKLLSKELDAPAVTISVFHSDTALLGLHDKGKRRGRVQIPEDGVAGEDGHRRIHAAFLAPLAGDPETKTLLEGEFIADFTFPEETVGRLATAIGLPRPGTGLRYAWHEPPEGARRLVFRLAEQESFDPRSRVIPAEAGHGVTLTLVAQSSLEAVDGFPLPDYGLVTLRATSGQTRGLRVEVSGPGLELIELRRLRGWNPKLDGETRIWEPEPEPDGDSLSFTFRDAQVVAYEQMGFDPALPRDLALQRWQRASRAQSDGQFMIGFGAHARQPGQGRLSIRAAPIDGAGESVSVDVALTVRRAPRRPVLPPSPDGPAALGDQSRLLEIYGGTDWLGGWVAFDRPWGEVAEFLLAAASDLSTALLDLSGAKRLEPSITSAGSHPKTKARFQPGGTLDAPAWESALEHLRHEAKLRLDVEGTPFQGGFIELRHQPKGTTVFTPEMRLHFGALGPQPRVPPVELEFALPRPEGETVRIALANRVEGWLRRAAERDCLGGHAGPSGSAAELTGYTAYERLMGLVRTPEDADWLRQHIRTPAWRVVVPRDALSALERARVALPPAMALLVEVESVPAGALVQAVIADPFSLTDAHRGAMETLLLGCVGSRAEALEWTAAERKP